MKESPTTSPYFQPSPSLPNHSNRSQYFCKAPSSVHGSIQSLGPLIGTWTDEDAVANCNRNRNQASETVCPSCQAIISKALIHFSECPQFDMKSIRRALDPSQQRQQDTFTASCVELVGRIAEQQVRHLCPRQCFLRAFSPCRDWWALRQAVHAQTNEPISRLLPNWTCQLMIPRQQLQGDEGGQVATKEGHESYESNTLSSSRRKKRPRSPLPERSNNPNLPRTVFVNRTDEKCYPNIPQALRGLGLDKDGDTLLVTQSSLSKQWNHRLQEEGPNILNSRRRLGFSKPKSPIVLAVTTSECLASPLGLLEELFGHNPWKLLLSTILLNRTRRIQVDGVLVRFLEAWTTPEATLLADITEMTNLIAPLGIKHRRARGIVQFSQEYLALVQRKQQEDSKTTTTTTSRVSFQFTREEILNLYHCGDYAADAYQIFIQRDWKDFHPRDYALRAYVEWKRSEGA